MRYKFSLLAVTLPKYIPASVYKMIRGRVFLIIQMNIYHDQNIHDKYECVPREMPKRMAFVSCSYVDFLLRYDRLFFRSNAAARVPKDR